MNIGRKVGGTWNTLSPPKRILNLFDAHGSVVYDSYAGPDNFPVPVVVRVTWQRVEMHTIERDGARARVYLYWHDGPDEYHYNLCGPRISDGAKVALDMVSERLGDDVATEIRNNMCWADEARTKVSGALDVLYRKARIAAEFERRPVDEETFGAIEAIADAVGYKP